MTSEKTGRLFNLQRHCTEDGPGVRTTVFLKGCSMHCPWCHNPEGISFAPELVWYGARCIGARDCLRACRGQALDLSPAGLTIDRSLCDACGACAEACPAAALEILGRRYTVDEVLAVVLRDRVFYAKSGGGMTVSGGEPSAQAGFALELMRGCRQERIHVALDTCAGVSWEVLRPLVAEADLVLLDLKQMDREAHRRLTGVPLDLVLANARRIADMGKPIWVRTPIVPAYTSAEDNVRSAARFIRDHLPTTARYDLLAFNKAAVSKYARLGHVWDLAGVDAVSEEVMAALAAAARAEGLEFVCWSGMTRPSPSREDSRRPEEATVGQPD